MFANAALRFPTVTVLEAFDPLPPGAPDSSHLEFRFLAALWLQDTPRWHLPLDMAGVAQVLRDREASTTQRCETDSALLQHARDALYSFATHGSAAHANARFLGFLKAKNLEDLRARTDAVVDALTAFLEEEGAVQACCETWTPGRYAATAVFYHKFVGNVVETGSKWRGRSWLSSGS